jgi:hypothetical protein
VLRLRQLTQVGTYLLHEPGEALDLVEQDRVVQVAEGLLAVAHGVGMVQVAEQNLRDKVTLLAITHDRRHDLVEVQVRREGAIRVLLADGPGLAGGPRRPEQQAGKRSPTPVWAYGYSQGHGVHSRIPAAGRSTGAISH